MEMEIGNFRPGSVSVCMGMLVRGQFVVNSGNIFFLLFLTLHETNTDKLV